MVVLVVGGEVALEVQAGLCSPSSPSAHLGGVVGVLAEELARAVVVPAQAVPAQVVPAQAVPAQVVPAQVVPAQVVPAQVVPAQVVPAQVAPAQVAPAQVMVRRHRHRQRIQIRPQSRYQAIWIATKSQTLKMVRSDPVLNQLG